MSTAGRNVQSDMFGLRGTPRRMLDVLAGMHAGSPDRWIPRRLVLTNWWLFDEPQEILFGRGNLMLTGKNESGKSTVLITIATLVLDRMFEPVRIDTTGGGDRTVRYYLVGKDEAEEGHPFYHDERTGYVALEFERGDSGRFRTIGIALRTARRWQDRKVRPWSFVLNEGCRIEHDVHLINPATHKPLREPELRAAIGDRGQVFGDGQQSEYNEAVNDLLFGFQSPDDYRRYLDALHILRTPKLGDGLSPARVEKLLVDSLPPVDMAPIEQAAESFQRMDTIEAQIRKLREQRDLAERLNDAQITALEAEANRLAVLYIEAHGEYKRRQKDLDRDLDKLEEARTKAVRADDRMSFLADEIARVSGPLQSLEEEIEDHGAGKTEERLIAIRTARARLAEEIAQLRADQERELEEAKKARESRTAEDERWSETRDEYQGRLGELIADANAALWPDLEQRGTRSLTEVGALDVGADTAIGTTLGAATIAAEATQRLTVIEPVIAAHEKLSATRTAYEETLGNERRARTEYQKRDGEYSDRSTDTETARTEAVAYLETWRQGFTLFSPAPASMAAVDAALREHADPEAPAWRVVQPLHAEFEHGWTFAQEQATVAGLERTRRQEAIEELDVRIDRLTSDADIEPPRTASRATARTLLLSEGIASVPLYEACAFADSLPAESQARIEETLEAAGLLDALIVPAGVAADVDRVLAASGLGDCWIRPAQNGGPASCLTAVPAPTVDRHDIERALAAIAFTEDAVAGDAPIAISRAGRWRLGDLTGLAPRQAESVRYIGEANRRAERERQLAAARAERAQLVEEADTFRSLQQEAGERERDLRAAWQSLRDARVFAALTTALVRQDEARIRRDEASANMSVLAAEVTKKHTAVRQAEQAVEQACGGARYLLSRTAEDVRRVQEALRRLPRLGLDVSGTVRRLIEIRRRWSEDGARIRTAEQRVGEFRGRIEEKSREDSTLQGSEQQKERQLAEESVGREELIRQRNEYRTELESYVAEVDELKTAKTDAEAVVRTLQPSVEGRTRDRDRARVEKEGAESRFRTILSAYPATIGWADDAKAMGLERFALDRIGRVNKAEIPLQAESAKSVLIVTLNEVRGSFQGLNARVQDGLMVMFTEDHEDLRVYDLLIRLDSDLAQKENALEKEDQEIIEKVFLRHVTEAIRTAITRTEAWRERVNDLLDGMDLFKGGTLRIQWQPREKKIETDAYDPKELAKLFSQTGISLREDRQEHLVQIFRDMISEIRDRARDQGLAIEYRAELLKLLDYKQWYNLEVHRKDESGRFRHLTRKQYGYGSMGRRSLDLILPLIAAVHGRLSIAGPDAPRLVGFDEAFAGVDDQNAAQIYALLDRVGLNWVMATEKAMHYGPHITGVVTYEFLNDGRDVAPIASVWDGQIQHSFEDEELPVAIVADLRAPAES